MANENLIEPGDHLSLDPQRIVQTIQLLRDRIGERFPASGLSRLAAQLEEVARGSARRLDSVARPHLPLRLLIAFVLGVMLAAFVASVFLVAREHPQSGVDTVSALVQTLSAVSSVLFYLGALILFLFTVEGRIKRRRALRFLRELRALAHIVDMHQLTKDPDRLMTRGEDTPSSPAREMSRFELGRYLDYCSEMLSLISKIAALYIQNIDDPVVLAAVDEVEALTTGLSRKIWQKIMILEQAESRLS